MEKFIYKYNADILLFSFDNFSSKLHCIHQGFGNLWLASQMWLFWWRHLARLIFP